MELPHRLVLVRHGETEGNSSVRFHGSGDVELSSRGRAQMREVRQQLAALSFDAVISSPLRRSWEAARIVQPGAPLRLEPDLREVDFGRWEGLTREEIQASDPILYADWQSDERGAEFRYPNGEARKDFEARVLRGLARTLATQALCALLVLHKGPIRVIAARLLGQPLAAGDEALELGGVLDLVRVDAERWQRGPRSSNPPALSGA